MLYYQYSTYTKIVQIGSRHEYIPTKKYEREFFRSRPNPYRGKAVKMTVTFSSTIRDKMTVTFSKFDTFSIVPYYCT